MIRAIRTILILAAAWGTGHVLSSLGWPWYAWLPAAILGGFFVAVLWFSVFFLIRKLTYPRVADSQKTEGPSVPPGQ